MAYRPKATTWLTANQREWTQIRGKDRISFVFIGVYSRFKDKISLKRCPIAAGSFVVRATTETKTMNTETTTGEYMLLFRGGHWDRGLTKEELQKAMDKVIAWFDGLKQRGRIKGAQPLGGQGRLISGTDGRLVVDGPFTETKEAVGGYLVLQADSLDDAVEIARSMPTLRHGISVEVRPILAECPIFQRHPGLLRREIDRAAEQLWVAAAA